MHRSVAISLITLALVAAVHSENVLKCYMCTSLSNEGCNSDLVTNTLQPVECTGDKMIEWQKSIEQHILLRQITWVFAIDEPPAPEHYQNKITFHNMACAKIILNISDQNVTVRTCQTAQTELLDPCTTIETKLDKNPHTKMEQCTLCLKQACNGAIVLSPKIFYIFLSFLAVFIHIAFNHRA